MSLLSRLLLLTCLAGFLFGEPALAAESRRPNIVVIYVDDLGYGELGCQGNGEIPTPHIDSIATSGIRCTQGYVTTSYCSPSRAGLLTGRYPSRFGYELNPVGAANEDRSVGLPISEVTLAEALQSAGYTTALIGKWHLGGTAAYHPLRRGFDEFFGFLHEGHFYVPQPYENVTTMLRRRALPGGGEGRWISRDGRLVYSTHMGHGEPAYDANNPLVRGSQPVAEAQYLTDAFTREAVSFIERTADRPFFLYLAYNAVHSPLQADNEYMKRFQHIPDVQRRIFAAMLSQLDDGVGQVLEKLRDEELDRETLLFFISDNGGPTRELTSSNAPLRGGKGDLYEGGVRVPFLVQWTGRLPAAHTYEQPVSSVDVFATAMSAAQVPFLHETDGVDLLPHLSGEMERPPHELLFWRMRNRGALRAGDWKIVRQPGRRSGSNGWELFNLAEDISETRDLAAERPEKLEELQAAWESISQEMP